MAEVISIQKSVQHNNGDSWELDNYPPFAQTDNAEEWLGVSEISLERAKELAFQLSDEAYDYEDEINNAEDLYELQDALDNLKYYQRDNTYNSSWWGGVVDFGVLTEDGEGYGTGLVLLRMHRGGDPRGNYYEMKAFELDSFIEEFPPYFGRLSYYIKTDEGDLTLDSEDMEGYSLLVVEDETGTFEQDDYVKIDEVEDAFDMNGNSFFSFGGGVAVGSLIGAYIGYKVGRARGKRNGGTFDTEKKIGRSIKGVFTKKKFDGGGGVYSSNGVIIDYYNGYDINIYPKLNEYWVNDEIKFNSMEDAKNYIDNGEMENEKYDGGGGVGEELMGGQPNSSKPSGYTLVKSKGREIIVTDDGGKTQERWIKSNGYSGYTLRYNGNQYEFTDSFARGGMTEHGLKEGDTIIGENGYQKDEVYVLDRNRNAHYVNLDKGQRFGNGGGVDSFNRDDNLLYLSSLSQEELTILLQNIANHYGVTKNEIYAEVTDFDSYPLYEYVTDESMRMEIYKAFQSMRYKRGGGVGEKIPYIVWVSKDGRKREYYGEYKSMKSAEMMAKKLIQSGDYESVGTKSKSNYEKTNSLFDEGGGIDSVKWVKTFEEDDVDKQYPFYVAQYQGFELTLYQNYNKIWGIVIEKDGKVVLRRGEWVYSLKEAKDSAIDFADEINKKFDEGGSVWEKNGFSEFPKTSPKEWELVEWSLNGNSPSFKGRMYFQANTGLMFIAKENGEIYKPISSNKLFWRKEKRYDEGGVVFTDYNGSSIMYEPNYNEYYVNDMKFDSMEEAKNYIDKGSRMDDKTIDAYRKGTFNDGGAIDGLSDLIYG
jgi:hypothetical protein